MSARVKALEAAEDQLLEAVAAADELTAHWDRVRSLERGAPANYGMELWQAARSALPGHRHRLVKGFSGGLVRVEEHLQVLATRLAVGYEMDVHEACAPLLAQIARDLRLAMMRMSEAEAYLAKLRKGGRR